MLGSLCDALFTQDTRAKSFSRNNDLPMALMTETIAFARTA